MWFSWPWRRLKTQRESLDKLAREIRVGIKCHEESGLYNGVDVTTLTVNRSISIALSCHSAALCLIECAELFPAANDEQAKLLLAIEAIIGDGMDCCKEAMDSLKIEKMKVVGSERRRLRSVKRAKNSHKLAELAF